MSYWAALKKALALLLKFMTIFCSALTTASKQAIFPLSSFIRLSEWDSKGGVGGSVREIDEG